MTSQSLVPSPFIISQIAERNRIDGAHLDDDRAQVALQSRKGDEMRLQVALEGIPVVTHSYAMDVCDQRDVDYVADAEASIMSLAPDLRRARYENLSEVLKWFGACEASWRALETLYTYGAAPVPGRPANLPQEDEAEAFRFFSGDLNAKAARERGRIVANLVSRFIQSTSPDHLVRIVSVASGSARAVLTGVKATDRRVHIKLIDGSKISLRYSADCLVSELGIESDVTCVLGNVRDIGQYLEAKEKIDIAEAVGILDYFDDECTIRLLAEVKEHLAEGGMLLASNVMDNPAREFLHTAVGWRAMHYRTVEEFVDLFVRAGFGHHQLMAHVTPSEAVYVIIEARGFPH